MNRIRRVLRGILGACLGATLAMSATSVALARDPMSSGLTMAVHVDFTTGTATWSASGQLSDSGLATAVDQRFGSLRGPSSNWTEHERIVFMGAEGSFEISQQALFRDFGPYLSIGTSHWVVTDGSGSYAGLRGRGSASIVGHWDVGTIDVALSGDVALANGTP